VFFIHPARQSGQDACHANSNLNGKVTGGLDGLTNVTFGRASDRTFIRFTVSATLYHQLEIYDDGPLVFGRSVDGAWATMWTK